MAAAAEESQARGLDEPAPPIFATELRRSWIARFSGTLVLAIVVVAGSTAARSRSRVPASGGIRPAVAGSFRLDYEAGFAERACTMITNQFVASTECICSLDLHHPSSVNYGCRHASMSCSGQTCGFPTYTGVVGLESSVSASRYCLNSLHVGQDRVGTLCLSFKTHEDSGALQSCKASLDGRMCGKCEICDGGMGVQLDCSRHDTRAISTRCDAAGLVKAIKGESSSIADFVPSFRTVDP